MIDIFDKNTLDINNITCHSGGADGSDSIWESEATKYNVKVKAYSYKTNRHKSINKVEISDEDFLEGIDEVNKANKWLYRYGIHKYMNLLARNWAQVKYSKEIFAIGNIINPGKKGSKGYYNRGKYQVVEGGTGYAVQMGINNDRDVYVFDQDINKWFRWSPISLRFIEIKSPSISYQDFAGVGTRKINSNGRNAIKEVYKNTFK